jgi:hypothetical protein
MTDNKRRAERLSMFKVVRYSIEGREYADLSTNISAGGIFIKNFSPPPIGTKVILTVKLSDEWGGLPMKIIGRVKHVNDDSDPHKRGMGIEFTRVVSDSLPIIEYFVKEVYQQEALAEEKLERKPSDSGEGATTFQYHILKQK